MTDIDWGAATEVTVPQGTFIGWGRKGQVVTGKVLRFGENDGTDFNGNPCPQLVVELIGDTENYKDKGTTQETLASGELATITAGQANLRRLLTTANLVPGDLIRVAYVDDYKTEKGTGKEFRCRTIKGTGAPEPAPAAPTIAADPFA